MIYVGQDIIYDNAPPAIVDYCKRRLTFANPDYVKKEQLGKWTGNTPREICLYERRGRAYLLPFGCLADVWAITPDATQYKTLFCPVRAFSYESGINLYPYQENAVTAALAGKNGVLVMPCGSGKTQCGLEIIARIGGRALWLTHTQDLLNQSRKRAEAVLGRVGCGMITAGKVALGDGITFATVQTMAKVNLGKYADYWDVVVVDECQHCAGSPTRVTQFYKVLTSVNARHKYGLTATPKRADGLTGAMYAILGRKLYEVTRADIKDRICDIRVRFVETGYTPDPDAVTSYDGTLDYAKLTDDITHDDDRHAVIFGEILQLHEPAIILANRVEYLQRMNDDLRGCGRRSVCLSGAGQSKAAKAERKAALEALNNGEIEYICATYQLAAEGLDVPNLKYIVFATPEKNETTVIQSAGRVGRAADGKEYGTVIDFVDNFGMYRGWARKRRGFYKKIDAEVIGT